MSHNHDESSYEKDDYDYEENARYGYVHREPRVPTKISNSPRTPVIRGQSSVIINTYDLMKQLYLMGDALNSFHSRLTIMEHRRKWRGHRHPRIGHAPEKALVIEGSAQGGHSQVDNSLPRITPWRLKYFDDVTPIVKLSDEDTDS